MAEQANGPSLAICVILRFRFGFVGLPEIVRLILIRIRLWHTFLALWKRVKSLFLPAIGLANQHVTLLQFGDPLLECVDSFKQFLNRHVGLDDLA